MIGLGFREHGSRGNVTDVEIEEPVPAAGEVRVRLEAAAFNHLDRFVLASLPGVPIVRPHVLGSDGAGRVDAVGEGVSDLREGAPVLINPGLWDASCAACRAGMECYCRNFRIVGEHTQGTATQFISVPRRNLHPIPSSLTSVEAAAFPLVFQTAYRALVTVGELRSGERLAVIGAGGGVATAAVQVGRWRGARVAVVTRSSAKAELARQLGAEASFVASEQSTADRQLWDWSERDGVDLVLDSVGAPTLARSIRSLARGGRVVVIGATAGPSVELDLRTLFWRQASIRGSTMATAREFEDVLGLLREGRVSPVIDHVYPWSERQEAWSRLESPELFGKVVIDLRGSS